MALFGSNLFRALWASWTCMSISFTKLGNFSFIIFSNKFSVFWSSSSGTPTIQMLKYLKLSQSFLSLSSFFWIVVCSFCSGWMFISSFYSKSVIWVPASFPSLLVPCIFFFISSLYCLHFFLYFAAVLSYFSEHPDYQCFKLCIWYVGYLLAA